jgi:hypothetical protein
MQRRRTLPWIARKRKRGGWPTAMVARYAGGDGGLEKAIASAKERR